MPTPSDESNDWPASIDNAESSRNFAGCPPEDDRLHSLHRQERAEGLSASPTQPAPDSQIRQRNSSEERPFTEDGPQQDSLQSVNDAGPSESDSSLAVEMEKAEHIEDAGIIAESSSPSTASTPDVAVETDVQLAQSMSATAISPAAPSPLYLHFPDAHCQRTRSVDSTTSFLRPGSKFRGTQQSDRQVYDVQVEIKDVDLAESFLCGYLRIQGLTDDHPTLTTFFEGEIIGPKYLFKTGHPSWNSSEKIDLQHWARFPAWRPLAKSAKSPNFTLKNFQQREHLFMRWKEYFLVPDHRVKTITGASFEGFYYICFNQSSGNVSGIYFHAKSEKYQQLELKHVDDGGCMPAIEFR